MFGFKSKRQVTYKPSDEGAGFRSQQAREKNPVLRLALTIHHDTRNQTLVNLFNAQGHCVSYSRALIMETALANAVVENTKQCQGLYVPPFLKKGTFMFLTHTLLRILLMARVQHMGQSLPSTRRLMHLVNHSHTLSLRIGDTKSKSLLVTPYHTAMLPCEKPKASASQQRAREFRINNSGVADSYQLTQLRWVHASTLSRMKDERSSQIPIWAGYNSLVSTSKPLTEVGALPLLPEVAHEWSTLLTVMKQAHQLKELTVGEEYITVITYDMALYAKAVQLVDAPSLPLGGCSMTLILGATLKVRLLFDTQHTVYSQWFGTAVHQQVWGPHSWSTPCLSEITTMGHWILENNDFNNTCNYYTIQQCF